MCSVKATAGCRIMYAGEKCGGYRIGIYVRESRDDNEENIETIETQRDLLLDFVQKNKLGEVVEIYTDDNVSGSAFDREGLQKLKNDVVQGSIDMIIVKDLSRLGRNNAKTLLLLDFLEEYGTRVLTFDGRYDSIRDNDTVGIDTWFNERYVRDISRKIRSNIRFKIQKGEYLGHAPYGYLKSPTEKNRLCVDSSTAHVVKEIFRLYKEGYGYQHIARKLDSKGYPPPSSRNMPGNANAKWNPIAVQRILSNRVYIGDTVQGVSEKVSFKSKKTRRLPPDRWVITKKTHEPIISIEEFEEVQRMRKQKISQPGLHKGVLHLFKGLLYCGKCGSVMFARIRKNRPAAYICGNYAKNGLNACSSHHIREKALKDIIAEELESKLRDLSIRTSVEAMLEKDMSSKDKKEDEIAKLEQSLIVKQRQQDTLYMDRLDGKISEQMFLRLNQNIENKISQLTNEIARLKLTKEYNINGGEILSRMLLDLKQGDMTNEMIKTIVEKITIYEYSDDIDGLMVTEEERKLARERGMVVIDFKYGLS